jgi:SAM-dependent methyltransferase
MSLVDLSRNWDRLGQSDPLWAVLVDPSKRGGRWDLDEFLETGQREIAHVLDHLEGLGVSVKRGAALDFGCGVGRMTQALASNFESVVGVDIAPSMVEEARRLNAHPLTCSYLVNTDPDLSVLGDRRFDFVHTCITLQHMEMRWARRYISEFVRVLTNDGVLVFDLPPRLMREAIPRPLMALYRLVRGGRGPHMELHGMDPAQVDRLVRSSGGRIVDREVLHDRGRPRFRYYVVRADG